MKLDYDLIKEILAEVQDKSDGFTDNHLERRSFENNDEGKKKFFTFAYHYKIAIKAGLIEGKILETQTITEGNVLIGVSCRALTAQGQQVLEGMRDEETSNKINDAFIKGGKEGLKQAPALALAVIMKFLGL